MQFAKEQEHQPQLREEFDNIEEIWICWRLAA